MVKLFLIILVCIVSTRFSVYGASVIAILVTPVGELYELAAYPMPCLVAVLLVPSVAVTLLDVVALVEP